METFDPQPSSSQDQSQFDKEINEASIAKKYKSQTFPFLLSFDIFNHNVHNCLVDFRASSNFMPLSICKMINGQPTPSSCRIIQLDRSVVKVIGEMKDVLIWLSADDIVCQFIDIMVVYISKAYGFILSRGWSTKLNGYFATKWYHMWLPYNNSQNQIKILKEPHMKYNVTQLEGKNVLQV